MQLKSKSPLKRPIPTLDWERAHGYPHKKIVGIDEAGRGCLAGPVVAACLILPVFEVADAPSWISDVRDSKLLSASERAVLFDHLSHWALDFAVGWATPQEIDQHNILKASHIAMERALDALRIPPQVALIDGPFVPHGIKMKADSIQAIPLIKGDQKSLSISGASILAKVWRDEWMQAQSSRFPEFSFAKHKGYPTPVHKAEILKCGVTVLHRQSFAPVREAGLKFALNSAHDGIRNESSGRKERRG